MGKETITHTIEDELNCIQLRDLRLNQRFLKVAMALSASTSMPINQACEDAASVKAAYRLFDNDKLSPQAILNAHQKQTLKRMQSESIVLAIQDTTYFNYSHHPSKEGLGPIGTSKQDLNGIVVHGTLVTTLNGVPLGRLTQQIWAREERDKKKASKQEKLKIANKESRKWFDALNEVVALTPDGVETITVCDRESDIYDFFSEAIKLQTYLLVRSAQNRNLEHEEEQLWNYMDSLPCKKHLKLTVPPKDKKPARIALAELRYSSVSIKRPERNSEAEDEAIELVAIWIKEIDPPKGVQAIRWMLLTNLLVTNSDEALQCIDWYKLRWRIEEYHKVIKSGCRVEDCRLETIERLCRYLTLMSVIAWRLFWITHLNRVGKDTLCTVVLTDTEWKALYCKIHKTKKLPSRIPTIYEAVRWIARLGGFLGRKSDGEPGITTIWRGWQRLMDIVEIWSIFNAP